MYINVYSKHSALSEFVYITEVIFEYWLGFEIRFFSSASDYVELEIEGAEKRLLLPDIFFSSSDFRSKKASYASLISRDRYEVPNKLANHLAIKDVPVFFKLKKGELDRDGILLSLDILGVSFFLLSRIEEYHSNETDEHGRYLGANSLMSKLNCADIPIVDIYLEILWHKILEMSPGLQRKQLTYKKNISCDVDNPFLFHSTRFNLLKRTAGDILYRKSLRMATQTLQGLFAGRDAYKKDPYSEAINFIIRENDKVGNKVQFNFIPYASNNRFDGPGMFGALEVKDMIDRITVSGHKVGIHPGYDTFDNQRLLEKSVDIFRQHSSEIGLIKGRQHYLRWEVGITDLLYESAGISIDSSLGNADVGGFRCGTSRAFPVFSLTKRKVLALVEEPLLIMENTYFSGKYLNYGVTQEALEKMLEIKRWCKKLNGVFTVLWHNTSLITEKEKEMYLEVIR